MLVLPAAAESAIRVTRGSYSGFCGASNVRDAREACQRLKRVRRVPSSPASERRPPRSQRFPRGQIRTCGPLRLLALAPVRCRDTGRRRARAAGGCAGPSRVSGRVRFGREAPAAPVRNNPSAELRCGGPLHVLTDAGADGELVDVVVLADAAVSAPTAGDSEYMTLVRLEPDEVTARLGERL